MRGCLYKNNILKYFSTKTHHKNSLECALICEFGTHVKYFFRASQIRASLSLQQK